MSHRPREDFEEDRDPEYTRLRNAERRAERRKDPMGHFDLGCGWMMPHERPAILDEQTRERIRRYIAREENRKAQP